MTPEEAVAQDVARRYGVAVDPAVVRRVPRGVSGIPLPVFREGKLVYPDGKERHAAAVKAHFRQARAAVALSPETAARRDRVRAAHAQGMTVRAIMEALSLPEYAVRMDLKRMGLQFHAAPPHSGTRPTPPAVVARRARVAEMLAQGMRPRAIARALGASPSMIYDDQRALAAGGGA